MRSYAAGGWTFARMVRLPGALPFFFTGLRRPSSLAVIAAVVAEYFGGLQDGLGRRSPRPPRNTAYPRAWAYVVGAACSASSSTSPRSSLERLAMPWQRTAPTELRPRPPEDSS